MYHAPVRLIHGLLSRLLPVPVVPIERLREGMLATVRGRVLPRDLMDSPLSGDRCVYYRYIVEEWRRSRVAGMGAGVDGFWQAVDRDEAILEFYIDDGTGRAIINPKDARVSRGRGIEEAPFELTIQQRAQQLLIEGGDLLEVTGEVVLADDLFDESRDYRSASSRFMVRAPKGGELRIRVVSKAGAPDPGE